MSPTLLAERSGRRQARSVRATPWLSTRVLFTRLNLDRELAEGADPAASPALMLRSEQLRSRKARERIARAIDRVLEMPIGERQPYLGPPRLPVLNRRVGPNVERFEELAAKLRGAGPHPVRGLAMASALIEDPKGPLYANDPAERLGEAVDAILLELEVEEADERS